jgi:hypothetical protein
MELLWLFGPLHHDEWDYEWKVMAPDIAIRLEEMFSSRAQMYFHYDDYLYDFCAMTQVNKVNGSKRSIKRCVYLHEY